MSRIAPGDESVIHHNVEHYQRLSQTDHNEATWRSVQKMLDELEAKLSLAEPRGLRPMPDRIRSTAMGIAGATCVASKAILRSIGWWFLSFLQLK